LQSEPVAAIVPVAVAAVEPVAITLEVFAMITVATRWSHYLQILSRYVLTYV
jgi:hypothetical protein